MSLNPIIPGFSPDPSVVKVDDWFFLVTSTFHLFPGIPIYASQDLKSWRHIGNAIHRPGQLSLARSATLLVEHDDQSDETMLASGGLYAPTIRHHQGVFYVVCTNVVRVNPSAGKEESHNFIVSCSDIWKCDWSDAVPFEFAGIDPSIFWDDDGRSYIQGSGGPGPKTTINQFEVDLATGRKLSEEKQIWAGTGGIYPEGPHIYKRNGWYYLEISEGGTYEDHCVVMARSKDLWGPYEANPNNPILTARGTDEAVQHTGHCDIFEDGNGQWWGVCLGVRKGKDGRLVMGRESFITPGRWEDDWLTLETVKLDPSALTSEGSHHQPITAKDGVDWLYIHDPKLENFKITSADTVTVLSTPVLLSEAWESPSFIGKRQRVLSGKSTATLNVASGIPGDLEAGIAVYKDEHRYLRIYLDAAQARISWELVNKAKKLSRSGSKGLTATDLGSSIKFSLDYTDMEYRLSFDAGDGSTLLATIDTLDMTGPDFVGPVIGVFAISKETTQSEAAFSGISIE